MADKLQDLIFDALTASSGRKGMPTALDTEGLRELSHDLRNNAVFTARGTSRIFASRIKEVVDLIASGKIDEATGKATLFETLQALGYTPEGGFPTLPGDAPPVPPVVQGTLQDLSSMRRLDLIIGTQTEIVAGAGQMARFLTPDRLEAAPAVELIRVLNHVEKRQWRERWAISGGRTYRHNGSIENVRDETGMICLKGDPVLGELGSSQNFKDALDIDHGPFVFRGGVGLREVSRSRCLELGVTGPNGETIDEWFASRPVTLAGRVPVPAAKLSVRDMDPELRADLMRSTGAEAEPGKPGSVRLPRLTPAERAARALAHRERERSVR